MQRIWLNKKGVTCFATLLQNELNSDVVLLNTHGKMQQPFFVAKPRFERCTFYVARFTVALMMFFFKTINFINNSTNNTIHN